MLAEHRRIRPWRALAYVCILAAGIILVIDPTRNAQPLPVAIRWVWSSVLITGALLSSYGAMRDRWLGEFVGIPFLLGGIGGLIWILVSGGGTTARLAFACLLGSIVVTLWRRLWSLWKFVRAQRRALNRQSQG